MITLQNVEYSYSSHKPVFKNLNLQLPEGHIYGLLGKNGIGKTTLLKILSGALFAKGNYNIDGIDPRTRNNQLLETMRFDSDLIIDAKNGIGYSTRIHNYAKTLAPLYPNFNLDDMNNILERLEVPTERKLYKMSKGEQRKALAAFSLACNTNLLMMDEPTNGMDITSRQEFKKLVAEQFAEKCTAEGKFEQTIIVSTHQVEDLDGLMDAVIILGKDNVLLCATLEEIGKQLKFGYADANDIVLYSEDTQNGKMCVMRNDTHEEMPVDLRLLFTATVKVPEKITPMFHSNL
ncbi:MAG: ABC transporter ATP-binding protein [Bacteroidales bacterium]|nr:ABC transporter ATP-binding protein [Bacteroidales bacterium]